MCRTMFCFFAYESTVFYILNSQIHNSACKDTTKIAHTQIFGHFFAKIEFRLYILSARMVLMQT